MSADEPLAKFGIELVKQVGDILAHRTKRIYLYGAGRVGKTTFASLLNNPKMRFRETADFSVTPGAEKSPYNRAQEISDTWQDYTIELHGFGGQGGKREQRWKHFDTVNPVGVIFIASPCIAYDEDHPDQYLEPDEMFKINRAALQDLIALLLRPREHESDLQCQYVLPVISFRDAWENKGIDYEVEFERRFQNDLAQLAHAGIRVSSKWRSYSAIERASMLHIVEDCLSNTGYVTNIGSVVKVVGETVDDLLRRVEYFANKAEGAADRLNPIPEEEKVQPIVTTGSLEERQRKTLIGSIFWRIVSIIRSMFIAAYRFIAYALRQLRLWVSRKSQPQ
jgi:hypothetical protein